MPDGMQSQPCYSQVCVQRQYRCPMPGSNRCLPAHVRISVLGSGRWCKCSNAGEDNRIGRCRTRHRAANAMIIRIAQCEFLCETEEFTVWLIHSRAAATERGTPQ